MKLWFKIKHIINYDNIHPVFRVLDNEFNLANKYDDKIYANEILNISNKILQDLLGIKSQSYMQKVWQKKVKAFIIAKEKEIKLFGINKN